MLSDLTAFEGYEILICLMMLTFLLMKTIHRYLHHLYDNKGNDCNGNDGNDGKSNDGNDGNDGKGYDRMVMMIPHDDFLMLFVLRI